MSFSKNYKPLKNDIWQGRFDEDNRTAKLAAIVVYAIINTIIEL
jgi:hypothetical protein